MALKNKLPSWTKACSTLELCSCSMCSYIHRSRSRVFCSNFKNFEEQIKRSCEEFTKPVHQACQSTFKRNKNRLG